MNPDETLALLRARVYDALHGRDFSPIRMAELFNGLDEWLSKGGFYPLDWQGAAMDGRSEAYQDGYHDGEPPF